MPAKRSAYVTELKKRRYGIDISWDTLKKPVDLDLQAVIVNEQGIIVDAVYYNNLLAMNGAIGHTGDGHTGDKPGSKGPRPTEHFDETVWVNLSKLPATVKLIIFVVGAAHGQLRDAANGLIKVFEEGHGNTLKKFSIESSMADVDIVAMMERCENSWTFIQIEEPADQGQHFIDILEPNIGDLIRKRIPDAPPHQTVTFMMEKGAVIDLPNLKALKRLSVAMGGAAASESNLVDLDISAVLYAKGGGYIGSVDGENSEMCGLEHSGDDKVTDGDEVITVDLLQVPNDCEQIFFILNVFTEGGTFKDVREAYCRIIDQNCKELAHFTFNGGHNEEGLILARLFRCCNASRRWGFQALGHFCSGRTWGKVTKELEKLYHTAPYETHQKPEQLGEEKMPMRPRLANQTSSLRENKKKQPAAGIKTEEITNGISSGSVLATASAKQSEETTPNIDGTNTMGRKLMVRTRTAKSREQLVAATVSHQTIAKTSSLQVEDTDTVPVRDELHDEKHRQTACNTCTWTWCRAS